MAAFESQFALPFFADGEDANAYFRNRPRKSERQQVFPGRFFVEKDKVHNYFLRGFVILNSVRRFTWCSASEHSTPSAHLFSNLVSPYPLLFSRARLMPFITR